LFITYNQIIDKLLGEVTLLKIIQAMYYNVTYRRIRAIIVAVEQESILRTLNVSLYTYVTSMPCACAIYSFVTCRFYYIFSNFLLKGKIKKKIIAQKCVS